MALPEIGEWKAYLIHVVVIAIFAAMGLGFYLGQAHVVPSAQDVAQIKTEVNGLKAQVIGMNDTLGRMVQALNDHGIHVNGQPVTDSYDSSGGTAR